MSTAKLPRQLNLDELRRLKWLLGGAMALVSLWTVFFLDIEALALVGIASAVIVAALIWPVLPAKLPAILWKLSVPAIIVAATLDFYLSPDTLPVLIRLAILLTLYRGASYRNKREDLQLIVLGMFLVVVAGVLTVSIGFAFLLLLFTAIALGFLFVINLIDASESAPVGPGAAGTAWTRLGYAPFFARLRAVADWRLLGFAAALFTAVVSMSGLLFLVIPRFELASGFFLDRYITRKSRTGFSENVHFGDVTDLVQDESVAMRVDLTETAGLLERPYWRMVVLDEYTPQGFRMSAALKAELLRNQGMTQRIPGRASTKSVGGIWTVYVEPGVSRFLPMPGSFGMLRLRDMSPMQISTTHRVFALRIEPMAMAAFQLEMVEQTPLVAEPRLATTLKDARSNPGRYVESSRYNPLITLVGPTGGQNEAVIQRILQEITGGADLPAEEFAQRATAWLQGRHAYSLSVRLPAGAERDDIVRWLDSAEPGFCEYFAAGLTVLARAAGFPARMITGFHGGVLNGFENYYMVRNSDAHAWVEIFDGQAAWRRYDPTPGASRTVEALAALDTKQTQDSSWSARFDSLRVLWYRRIVNFDSRAQVEMMEQVKVFTLDSSSALRARVEAWAKQFRAWAAGPWDAWRAMKTLGLLLGLASGLWMIVTLLGVLWQRLRRWRRPQEFDPVRRQAGRWLGRLRTKAVEPQVVADLQRLRYGRRETWPEAKTVFRRARAARRKRD